MTTSQRFFLCPVCHISFHILFAVVLFQNELITAVLGRPAVQNDREPQMMCNGLTCLFILDLTIHFCIPPKNGSVCASTFFMTSVKQS